MITEAILKINPNAEVSVSGEDINTCEITWHNGTTPISKTDIEAKMNEMANTRSGDNFLKFLHLTP